MMTVFEWDMACRHGVPAAILVEHLRKCVLHERAMGVAPRDGRIWTAQSPTKIYRYHPYLSLFVITGAINRLVRDGVLLEQVGEQGGKKMRDVFLAFADEETMLGSVGA